MAYFDDFFPLKTKIPSLTEGIYPLFEALSHVHVCLKTMVMIFEQFLGGVPFCILF